MKADTKMTEEFYDWLDNCPVNWIRTQVNDETLHYSFDCPDDVEDDYVIIKKRDMPKSWQNKLAAWKNKSRYKQ